ncbi:hypothetical protein CLV82_1876 [Zeaxanthinibacter enoshimensis]|uniref:Uncharacterized protein n=1 Tax=Zeaxanthinibacter enoshimensis TaxID=392009 RepID=A0A4R6TJV7_9FLAO|nr:hypothetical protein CLV82_1876 [Zeaxanthinibacter enoshimensis]
MLYHILLFSDNSIELNNNDEVFYPETPYIGKVDLPFFVENLTQINRNISILISFAHICQR